MCTDCTSGQMLRWHHGSDGLQRDGGVACGRAACCAEASQAQGTSGEGENGRWVLGVLSGTGELGPSLSSPSLLARDSFSHIICGRLLVFACAFP